MMRRNNPNTFSLMYSFKVIILVAGLFAISHLAAQTPESDIKLIAEKEVETYHAHQHQVKFGVNKKETFVAKYNPLNLTFSSLMFVYQKWISPQISSNCYYQPSCSAYSKLLFQKYGFFKGLVSSADRLMRCDRISATSFHPVSINPVDGKIHEDVFRYKFKDEQ